MKYLLLLGALLLQGCSSMHPLKPLSWLPAEKADVYIQAGHEGRTSGSTGASSEYGEEIKWTPVVADAATKMLENAGVAVIRSDADRSRRSEIKLAVSIHFDESSTGPCQTGASIGYKGDSDKPAADAWKELYTEYFKFKWMKDNFTSNLEDYYGFRYTITEDSELVLELGDISCQKQVDWLKPRLTYLGELIAYFAAQRIGNDKVKKPAVE